MHQLWSENLKKKKFLLEIKQQIEKTPFNTMLENKMFEFSKELEQEKNHEKQQQILKSINSLVETIDKLKKKQ